MGWDSYKTEELEKDKYSHLHKNRRNKIQKQQYDALQKIEKQKFAIDKLQSDEFQTVLKRFYSGGLSDINNTVTDGKSIKDYTKSEMIEKFYQDRIWSGYNTAGVAVDVGLVLGKEDTQYKSDWAEITQVYADLPYFGKGTIGFSKWVKDFAPALISDPLNLFSFGTAGTIAREAIKTPLKGLAKKEFQKQAAKAAAIDVAKKEAVAGATIGAGLDMMQQSAELETNLTDDYNITRTLLAAAAGGVGQGVVGSAMGYWSAKGKAGKFYDKGNGFKGDYDRDFGLAGSNADVTYSGRTGKIIEHPPKNPKLKKPVKIKNKPDESPVVEIKANDIKRKTPIINLNKIDSDPKLTPTVRVIVDAVNNLKKEGRVRVTERTGLLQTIANKANNLLKDKKASKKLQQELISLAQDAPQFAEKILVGRYNLINKSKEIVELRKLSNETVTLKEKIMLSEKLFNALKENSTLLQNHVETVQGVSDALNQQKITVGLTEADRLRIETDTLLNAEMPKLLKRISRMSPEDKIKAIDVISSVSGNDEKMRKILRNAKRKDKDKRVTLWEAINEYTTANLLGDPTTHEINILSSGIRYQANYIENFISGFQSLRRGERDLAVSQFKMAADLMSSQFSFFNIAFKKAQLAWKANRNVGDVIEQRFESRRILNMQEYFKQLKESDNMFKQAVSYVGSPIGRLSFLTLKGLGAGDTFMKNIFQRAARVANVNQRMRTFYPQLWKNKKNNLTDITKTQDLIISVKENLRFEKAQDVPNTKKIKKLNDKLLNLEQNKTNQTPFEKKWSELYYQYEDEFGNFRPTKDFSAEEITDLDLLTKSVSNDPTYISQVSSFTQKLESPLLDANQFYPNQKQSEGNIGQLVLDLANKNPLLRVVTGLHFVKTPVNLFKYDWQRTPFLNKLNLEFRGMLNASDPIVRQKAESIQNFGRITYAMATYMAINGNITDWREKDPKHRFAYKYEDDNGEMQYISLTRLFPLSIPFLTTAAIKGTIEEGADMWNDSQYNLEQEKMLDYLKHVSGSAFALWSNLFASQLMTQDFFEMMSIFSEGVNDSNKGLLNVEKLGKQFGRTLAKFVPVATTWRWTNKVLAEAEVEVNNLMDSLIKSTPYELSKKINEQLFDGKADFLNYGDALAPKPDPLGNVYAKQKGLLLGDFQDILPTNTHWSNNMVDKNGVKINLTQKAKNKLANSNIMWNKPAFTLTSLTYKNIDMRTFEAVKAPIKVEGLKFANPNKEKFFTMHQGATLYETMRVAKSRLILGGMTLNERIADELENPKSEFNNRYKENQMFRGKYEGDSYLLEIIKDYEEIARDYVKEHVVFNLNGVNTTFNAEQKKLTEQEILREENLRK